MFYSLAADRVGTIVPTLSYSVILAHMTAFALLFTLAAIGLAETSYLIRKRRAGQHAVCVIGNGCGAVLESAYRRTLGVYNDVLGFVFYAAMMLVTALAVTRAFPTASGLELALIPRAMLLAAVLMTLRFVYLQWRVIKTWCFWCLMSAATIGLMVLVIII